MEKIQKAKETMSAKERVWKTFQHEKTDRVTIGYEANENIHRRVARALGIEDGIGVSSSWCRLSCSGSSLCGATAFSRKAWPSV